MKSLGKDKRLRLAAVQETIEELRTTFDFFSANLGRLKEKLVDNPHWLVETMWQIRNEVRIVMGETPSQPTGIATDNKLIGLTLDLEYLEDRVVEFEKQLPEHVNPQIQVEFDQLTDLLRSAESALSIHELHCQLAWWHVEVEVDGACSLPKIREEARDYLQRLEDVTVAPKSLKLSLQLTRLRIHYESLLKQLEFAFNLHERAERRMRVEAREKAKLDRFCDAQVAVATSCRKAKEWLELTPDEQYEQGCKAMASEVHRAMSELGSATGDLQHRPDYGKYRGEYDVASSNCKLVLASIDKAVQHYQNSSTWWGRFANWIDDRLKTKEPM